MADGVREALFSAQAEIIPTRCIACGPSPALLRSGGDNSAESVQRAEERTQALAETFSVVEGKAQATQATIQLLTDTMSAPQADFEIFGKKGLAGAFEQLNAQADKLKLKDFGLDVAGAAKAISGSQKDYDAYIASLDQLAEKQVSTQRANTRTKDSWDADRKSTRLNSSH